MEKTKEFMLRTDRKRADSEAVERMKKVIRELTNALSRIDYIVGKPNEMELALYDVDCDEEAVIARVKKKISSLENKCDTYRSIVLNEAVGWHAIDEREGRKE